MPSSSTILSDERQLTLSLSPMHNQGLLSNHWLEHRLPLEPEWAEQAEAAKSVLERLLNLWQTERNRVELYGDEAGLEQKFIQPVFEILRWQIKYQTYLKGREPDYALFVGEVELNGALHAGRTNPDFWEHATAVADAKAWHVSLDRPTRVGRAREYPPEQIEWYLNHSQRDFGILTNGRLWRLIPRELGPSKPRFQTYLEIDLPALLDSLMPEVGQLRLDRTDAIRDDFLRFFLLFSPVGFVAREGRTPLIRRAISGSSEYSLGVGEELKDRVFEAQRLCVEGFIKHDPNGLDAEQDLQECQQHSLIFLYRLLFIMYAEDRGLLPYRKNGTYTNNRSLARHRDEIASRLDQVYREVRVTDYGLEVANLWQDLQDLFDLIDRGHRRYGVQAYNGGLFDLEADTFLSKKVLPDWYLARVLDQLGRAAQPDRPELGLFRVDYRDLAIQQLGSVYEGLLELHPRFATCDMRMVKARRGAARKELIIPAGDPIPAGYDATLLAYRKGEIYLATDKGERRRTGSYYTPDHIVDHIVQKTLGAKCAALSTRLQEEIAAKEDEIDAASSGDRARLLKELDALRGDFDDRVLRLKVLDPAMGSGHFLIRACQYLAEEIATNPNTSDRGAEDLHGEESTITYWKRKVAENCLHGVDLNPMAVELAKLALWLETVAADAPLTFLDHHLQCGDSIVGATIDDLNSLPRDKGLLHGQFSQEVERALPKLLEPLDAIAGMASDTAEHVKEKESIYRRRFLPVLQRYSLVADLWTAEAMSPGLVRSENYATALGLLSTQRRFADLARSEWVAQATGFLKERKVRPFHWELAFPHVFLTERECIGFDVILGNPPYDVLSEKESGVNIAHIKRFIELDDWLEAARVGKKNLYKLFIAGCMHLLAREGYFSFIVPMPLLGDEQTRGIRKMMLEAGEFREIHAFPQKDSVARRVFPDAKLATALFVYQKSENEAVVGGSRFASYVHPGRFIENSETTHWTDGDSIRVYDPENLTIVSCTQQDWDLMSEIPRDVVERLGIFVPFFQGEVNQTVATEKGFLSTPGKGPLITRGANISLYQLREASQGEDIYLNVEAFLKNRDPASKAFHHQYERVGLQESSAQNNFRRIIACRIPTGCFCNHKINYTTAHHASIPLELVLFVLNSAFADWYFRLGSTNAAVSHYQLRNIPCPRFGSIDGAVDIESVKKLEKALCLGDFTHVREQVLSAAMSDGLSPTLEREISTVVRYIEAEEAKRGQIARTARSALSENGARCQEILDCLMLILIGLGADRDAFIQERLEQML